MSSPPNRDPDALLHEVLSAWSTEDPPDDFAARVAAMDDDMQLSRPTPPPSPSFTRSWVIPAVTALAAAALLWIWLRPGPQTERTEATQPLVSKPIAGVPEDLESRWCDITRQIEEANRSYPFTPGAEDLPWATFDALYGQHGTLFEFSRRLSDSERARLDPSARSTLEHASLIQAILYDGEASARMRGELTLGQASFPRCMLLVDGDVVARCDGRPGQLDWDPASQRSVELRVQDFGAYASLQYEGPWALVRLLSAGALGRNSAIRKERSYGPLVFDFSDEGLNGRVTLQWEWPSGSAAVGTGILTTPVPVPERLFEDSPRCDGRTKMSKTDITGGGNAKALRATIKHRTSALQHCYDKALRTQPDLAGKMTYKIFISVMGTVTKVVIEEDSLGSAAVATCTETTIRGWRFPMNGADEGAEVTFSVAFSGS